MSVYAEETFLTTRPTPTTRRARPFGDAELMQRPRSGDTRSLAERPRSFRTAPPANLPRPRARHASTLSVCASSASFSSSCGGDVPIPCASAAGLSSSASYTAGLSSLVADPYAPLSSAHNPLSVPSNSLLSPSNSHHNLGSIATPPTSTGPSSPTSSTTPAHTYSSHHHNSAHAYSSPGHRRTNSSTLRSLRTHKWTTQRIASDWALHDASSPSTSSLGAFSMPASAPSSHRRCSGFTSDGCSPARSGATSPATHHVRRFDSELSAFASTGVAPLAAPVPSPTVTHSAGRRTDDVHPHATVSVDRVDNVDGVAHWLNSTTASSMSSSHLSAFSGMRSRRSVSISQRKRHSSLAVGRTTSTPRASSARSPSPNIHASQPAGVARSTSGAFYPRQTSRSSTASTRATITPPRTPPSVALRPRLGPCHVRSKSGDFSSGHGSSLCAPRAHSMASSSTNTTAGANNHTNPSNSSSGATATASGSLPSPPSPPPAFSSSGHRTNRFPLTRASLEFGSVHRTAAGPPQRRRRDSWISRLGGRRRKGTSGDDVPSSASFMQRQRNTDSTFRNLGDAIDAEVEDEDVGRSSYYGIGDSFVSGESGYLGTASMGLIDAASFGLAADTQQARNSSMSMDLVADEYGRTSYRKRRSASAKLDVRVRNILHRTKRKAAC